MLEWTRLTCFGLFNYPHWLKAVYPITKLNEEKSSEIGQLKLHSKDFVSCRGSISALSMVYNYTMAEDLLYEKAQSWNSPYHFT